MEEEKIPTFKLVIIGDGGVGKVLHSLVITSTLYPRNRGSNKDADRFCQKTCRRHV